jgi:hypothetical protein
MAAPHTMPGWRDELAGRLAHYLVTPAYQRLLSRQGIAIDRDALLSAVRNGDRRAVRAAVEPLLDRYCVSDLDGLRRQLADAAAAGVDGVVFFVPAQGTNAEPYEAELAELISEITSR